LRALCAGCSFCPECSPPSAVPSHALLIWSFFKIYLGFASLGNPPETPPPFSNPTTNSPTPLSACHNSSDVITWVNTYLKSRNNLDCFLNPIYFWYTKWHQVSPSIIMWRG
jgi:hypothetical protein